ncbi:hypothetical protein F4806DRAFT_485141 [Annulohypoxylon nitens]|nr:hypothetical protein F4806DRAFT_485141 [Annulohypoxylon nitens]
MMELPAPTNAPGNALPGSAEWLSTHLTGLGFGCKHLQKYSIRNEQIDSVFPSRLGFFYNAAENNARISFLDTKKLCNNCLALVVPEGYNCWLTSKCPSTGPQSNSLCLPPPSASPSLESFPLFFQAGTERLFDVHGMPRVAVKLCLQATAPVAVPMPQLPGLKEAWGWIQCQRKPFYIDQLHLTKGWNNLAQRAAERDCIIVQKHGLAYTPVAHAACPEPIPDAFYPKDERVPRVDKPTKNALINKCKVSIEPLHREEPMKALKPNTSLPETSTEILIEKPPKAGKPLSKSLSDPQITPGQAKVINTPTASFGDVVTALFKNMAVKARPKDSKSDAKGVRTLGSKEISDQDFLSGEVRSQSPKCITRAAKNEHPTLDENIMQDIKKAVPMKNWCRHGPIPFDSPIATPKLSDFMRRAEVADEETRSVANLPLIHMRGKGTKIDDSIPLVGPGSTATTVGQETFLALRGKKGVSTPLADSKFIGSTFGMLGTAIKEKVDNHNHNKQQKTTEHGDWNKTGDDVLNHNSINQTPSNQISGNQNLGPQNSGDDKLSHNSPRFRPLSDQNSNIQKLGNLSLDDQCPHDQNLESQTHEDQSSNDIKTHHPALDEYRKEDDFGEADATKKRQRHGNGQHAEDEQKAGNDGTDFNQYHSANKGRTPYPTQKQESEVSTPLQSQTHELQPQGETFISNTPSGSTGTGNTALEVSRSVGYPTSTAERILDKDENSDKLPRLSSEGLEKETMSSQFSKDDVSTRAPIILESTPNHDLASVDEIGEALLAHGSKASITSPQSGKSITSPSNSSPFAAAAAPVGSAVSAEHVTSLGLLNEGQGTDPDRASLTTNRAVNNRVFDNNLEKYTHNYDELSASDSTDDEANDPYQYYFQSSKNPDSEYEDNVPYHNGANSNSDANSDYSEEGESFNYHDYSNNIDDGLAQYPDYTFTSGSSDDDSNNENGLTVYNSESEDNESGEEEYEGEADEGEGYYSETEYYRQWT